MEKSKYGWFWECPNGEKCIYRHALPPGYVLKRDKKKMDEQKKPDISLVDLIERERNALGSCVVRLTDSWNEKIRYMANQFRWHLDKSYIGILLGMEKT